MTVFRPARVNQPAPNAAVLWTGGKDSVLALHEAEERGFRVRCLLTFAPPNPDFLAHPVAMMKLQAEALSLPHLLWQVEEPFAESYETGLRWLKKTVGIDTVVTGDIAEVGGNSNWIRDRSRAVGIKVFTPVWGRDRLGLLQKLLALRFKVIFSCVNQRWLNASWVGRELNPGAIAELQVLRGQNGLDLCGEEGEFHTLVTDAPGFKQRLNLGLVRVRERNELAYLDFDQPGLLSK
jgi:uncharacterized protein (TIGR00290 family)